MDDQSYGNPPATTVHTLDQHVNERTQQINDLADIAHESELYYYNNVDNIPLNGIVP